VRRKQTIAPLDADDLHPWDAPRLGKKQRPPPLDAGKILRWADAWHKRHGKWPKMEDGPIPRAPLGTTWRQVDNALRLGLRGLPGGSSLARLLAAHRHYRNMQALPGLTESLIERWARTHFDIMGDWPTEYSGAVLGVTPAEDWRNIDAALRGGHRGLPGGDTLPRLLGRLCGVRTWTTMPQLTETGILAWADAERDRSGSWPTADTGPILEAPGETWSAVENALRIGLRGLPGGSSLARLLAEHRGVRNKANLPELKEEVIVALAAAHHERTGQWPSEASGSIADAPGETWKAVNLALFQGLRGLPGGSSLYQLLRARLRIPGRRAKNEPVPPPSEGQLRLCIDRMRDQGIPMLAIARLLGMEVEEAERLHQLPSRRKKE
jgi:hypothetical protein